MAGQIAGSNLPAPADGISASTLFNAPRRCPAAGRRRAFHPFHLRLFEESGWYERHTEDKDLGAEEAKEPTVPPTLTSGSGKSAYRSRRMLTALGSTPHIAADKGTVPPDTYSLGGRGSPKRGPLALCADRVSPVVGDGSRDGWG